MVLSEDVQNMDVTFLRQFLDDLRKKLQHEDDPKERKKIENMIRMIESELISRI